MMKNFNKLLQPGLWNNFKIAIANKLLTNDLIKKNLNQWWND
jgi:hypothetical protein